MLWQIKQNDVMPSYRVTLTSGTAGKAVDLTGASRVSFHMKARRGTKAITADGVISDGAKGKVEYRWATGNTDTVGFFDVEIEVWWGPTVSQTFPNDGYETIEVVAQLDSVYDPTEDPLVTDFKLVAADPDLIIAGAITRDANGAATTASVTWPDGTAGTYTGVASATFLGAVDSYSITYGSPATRTYTQPTVTRDANGAVTNRPAITVS